MLALLYDVHGNLPALEAVLDDCPADRFLLGGDYTCFGAWPRETVARLHELDAEWIRGNVDRWMVDDSGVLEPMRPLVERSRELLGEELARELAALPESTTRDGTLYCHASPLSDMDSFYPEPDERDAERLMGVEAEPGGVRPHPPPVHARGARRDRAGQPRQRRHAARRRPPRRLRDRRRRRLASSCAAWSTTGRRAARAVRERVGELPAKRIEQSRFDVS